MIHSEGAGHIEKGSWLMSVRLYVGNLAYSTTGAELQEARLNDADMPVQAHLL